MCPPRERSITTARDTSRVLIPPGTTRRVDADGCPRSASVTMRLVHHASTVPPLIVVAGPTATGKTELGIRLAERRIAGGQPAVVISADSRQVYRGLDIGTAKVGVADRARVPHHGLDLVDPDQPFSVADFARHAREVLADVAAADGVAILVGGTGLYQRVIARGIATESLPSDPRLRADLEADLLRLGPEAMVQRLLAEAPILAETTELANPRRVVRALEIALSAGDGPRPEPRGYDGPLVWLGLHLAEPEHRRRIAARARAQFDAGLVDEARALRERFDPGLPAFSAIGYREAWSVIDGTATLEQAVIDDAARNMAFAKRQRTWYRSERAITWIDATHADPLPAAVSLVEAALRPPS
jgi:tRNA dimethylallyltransferase